MSVLLSLLAVGSTFQPTEGVAVSCLENVRGRQGRARVEVVVGSGAIQEAEDERGVAHLLEHLVLRPLGFDDGNGATGWDFTSYHRNVRADELTDAAEGLLSQIANPALDPEEVELEKRIVLRELEDRGTSHLEGINDPLFADSLLARYPGGSASAVRDLDAARVRVFHRQHYVKGNLAVLLRGAVDCATTREALAPVLARFSQGPAAAVPRIEAEPPGQVTLPASPGVFEAGYYWYQASAREEVVYRLLAKHLEQRALEDLRKARGITYSPSARFARRGGGGQFALSVRTEGEEHAVEQWYEDAVQHILSTPRPEVILQPAMAPLRESLEQDGVRAGLAAIRGEPDPLTLLNQVDDASLKLALPRLLAESRAFGSTVPASNAASLIVLLIFGVVVLAALFFAARAFMSH